MSDENAAWRIVALEVYRLARLVLLAPRPPSSTVEEEYYIEELTEGLLDLKEATLALDEDAASRHIDEITVILAELRRLW